MSEKIIIELESIKKLLILNLISQGIPHAVIAKTTGMSTKTLYKFIPKNLSMISKKDTE